MATIVDVRTPAEFDEGHVPGSINVPLDEVPQRVSDFKSMTPPIILCCRSGARSGSALAFLKQQGVQGMENGGSWNDVLQRMNH